MKLVTYATHDFRGRTGRSHLTRCLYFAYLCEKRGDLLGALRAQGDYLRGAVGLLDTYAGSNRDVAYGLCAELIERSCCFALAILGKWSGVAPWLPSSSIDLQLRRVPMRQCTTAEAKEAVQHIRASLIAAASLGVPPAPTRFRVADVERLGCIMLAVLLHRARTKLPFVRDGEAKKLIVDPLRNLGYASYSGRLPPRLALFAGGVATCVACVRAGGISSLPSPLLPSPSAAADESIHVNLESFAKSFSQLLQPRGGLASAWWPSAWAAAAIGEQSYLSLCAPDANVNEVLKRAAASLHAANFGEFRQALQREPGFHALSLKGSCKAAWQHAKARPPGDGLAGDGAESAAAALRTLPLQVALIEDVNAALLAEVGQQREPPAEASAVQRQQPQEPQEPMVITFLRALVNPRGASALRFKKMPKYKLNKLIGRLQRRAATSVGRNQCVGELQSAIAARGATVASPVRLPPFSFRLVKSLIKEMQAAAQAESLNGADAGGLLSSLDALDKVVTCSAPSAQAEPAQPDEGLHPTEGGSTEAGTPPPAGEGLEAGEAEFAGGLAQGTALEAEEEEDFLAGTGEGLEEGDSAGSDEEGGLVGDASAGAPQEAVGGMGGQLKEDSAELEDDASLLVDQMTAFLLEDDEDGDGDVEAISGDYAGVEELAVSARAAHAMELSSRHERARHAIATRKASILQRVWREKIERSKAAVDPAVEMYLERLAKYDEHMMESEGYCLWCGCDWNQAGPVWEKHSVAREHTRLRQHFADFAKRMRVTVGPLLARLDALKLAIAQDGRDEREASQRFQAQDELESTYDALVRCLDAVEARRGWDRLAELISSCDFAERACQLAETLLNGQAADADGGGPITAGATEAQAPCKEDEAGNDDEDDADDEEALLERSVRVARAREQGGKASRQRGFGGRHGRRK